MLTRRLISQYSFAGIPPACAHTDAAFSRSVCFEYHAWFVSSGRRLISIFTFSCSQAVCLQILSDLFTSCKVGGSRNGKRSQLILLGCKSTIQSEVSLNHHSQCLSSEEELCLPHSLHQARHYDCLSSYGKSSMHIPL